MKHQEKPIIIVKKRKHGGHGGGHGSWKIAYADFMTAMMAFFLVMWLISIASPTQLAQIADYFRTPLAAAITGGHRLTDSTSPIPGGGDDVTQQQGEVKKAPKIDELDKLQKDKEKSADEKRLERLQGDLNELIESDPRLRALRPHLRIDLVKQGLRIQIIDSQNRPMFKLGSADVEPYMRDILRAIAPVLNTIPNKLTISGHTDDLPYARGERSYSNWELSADRANASRRELVAGGLDDGKVLRVVGMAATMNLSDKPDDALNRRISLVVLNKAAEKEIMDNNAESENVSLDDIKDNKVSPEQTEPNSTSTGEVKADSSTTTSGDTKASGDATTSGNTKASGDATTSGNTKASGDATASGDTTTAPTAPATAPDSAPAAGQNSSGQNDAGKSDSGQNNTEQNNTEQNNGNPASAPAEQGTATTPSATE